MAKNTNEGGYNSEPITELVHRSDVLSKIDRQADSEETLERVKEKDGVAVLLPEKPKHVRGSDIATAMLPYIDTGNFSGKESAWKRTQEVADNRDDNKGKNHAKKTRLLGWLKTARVAIFVKTVTHWR